MTQTKALVEENILEEIVDNGDGMGDCPVATAIDVIGGKWTIIVLYHLRGKTMRFGELKKDIPKITQKVLTHELRQLEANKLVTRKVYPEVPPRVEYKTTALADQLNPILDQLCAWGSLYRAAQIKA